MSTQVQPVKIGNIVCGSKQTPLTIIAGPCVIESRDLTMRIAERLKQVCEAIKLPLVFKASFDKANRTSATSYRGVGIDGGLSVLDEVSKQFDLPVVTDIHLPEQAAQAAHGADVRRRHRGRRARLQRYAARILRYARLGLDVGAAHARQALAVGARLRPVRTVARRAVGSRLAGSLRKAAVR